MFRRRFWFSLALSIPVFAFSEPLRDWFGLPAPSTAGGLVAPVFGTALFVYGGWPFLSGAVSELRARQPGMMTLVSLAITVAFGASLATELGTLDLDFWWELAALIVVMLLGHWLEMRAVGQARGALQALAELLPDEAERIDNGTTETVAVSELRIGDVVLVRPGARVPADGEIVSGAADLDESMITGESRPVVRREGDRVVAGTVSTDSAVRVRVNALGEDTALAGIQRLVADAQQSRSRSQALADRAAAALFYIASAAAAVTVAYWSAAGDVGEALTRAITVLVISCPHALGLAIPLVIAISTSLSARAGILVRDRLALERMRLVDVVLFDKTGTLTRGEHVLVGVTSVDGDDDRVLALAAAAEGESEHPLARAIVAAAADRGALLQGRDFRASPGRGVEASVDGVQVAVGGPALLRERALPSPPQLTDVLVSWQRRGAAVLHVVREGTIVGALAVEDQVRAESREAVDRLHALGVRVAMITGDARQVADAVATDLGIDEVFAEVLPEDKDVKVAELQARGHAVAMVGDGVNDAPALARADVGLAIGAGTDVAMQAAGVVLASSDPRAVLDVIRLSRAGYRKMLQNLGWAIGYNVVAIPLAAGVAAPLGLVLAPAVGAVLMSASTIVVALNAQLLRRLDLRANRATPPAAA
jgi:Cu2+-exporting ATPase